MLGKLIKNEFVQRGRNVCLLWLLAFCVSVFNYIVLQISYGQRSNDALSQFAGVVTIVTILALIGSFAMIIGISFTDYNTRLFKDQGYLTHTLPVKTEQILFARIIGDLVIAAITAILYPTFICIACGNFNFWKNVLDGLNTLFFNSGELSYIAIFVLTILCIMFFYLMITWHYYASYALGHSFSVGKRGMSILIYIGLYMVAQLILIALTGPSNELHNKIKEMVDYEYMKLTMITMGSTILVMAIATIVCFFLTNFACKKKLNLE